MWYTPDITSSLRDIIFFIIRRYTFSSSLELLQNYTFERVFFHRHVLFPYSYLKQDVTEQYTQITFCKYLYRTKSNICLCLPLWQLTLMHSLQNMEQLIASFLHPQFFCQPFVHSRAICSSKSEGLVVLFFRRILLKTKFCTLKKSSR